MYRANLQLDYTFAVACLAASHFLMDWTVNHEYLCAKMLC